MGGRVFDILGEVFEEQHLRDQLIEAIRYGADPEVRTQLHRQVEGALDSKHLEDILKRNALYEEVMRLVARVSIDCKILDSGHFSR